MKGSGLETRPVGLVFIQVTKELFTKAIGPITNKMDMESKNGLMVVSIRENSKTEKSMGKEFMFGLMVAFTQEDGSKTCSMFTANISGKMEGIIKASG